MKSKYKRIDYKRNNDVVTTFDLQAEITHLQELIEGSETKAAIVRILEENGFFKIWSSVVCIPEFLKVKANRLPIRVHRSKNFNLHGHHDETYLVCRVYDRKTFKESPLCWIKFINDDVYKANREFEQHSQKK